LQQFESYSAAREFFVRISAIFAFGVKYSYCQRKVIIGAVVVADNKINTAPLGFGYFIS
jgi:hypothetical protein